MLSFIGSRWIEGIERCLKKHHRLWEQVIFVVMTDRCVIHYDARENHTPPPTVGWVMRVEGFVVVAVGGMM